MAETASFTPGGKAEKMLDRLERGPASRAELLLVAMPQRSREERRKRAWPALRTMLALGLCANGEAGELVVTAAGADALACLRAGHPARFARPGRSCEAAA